VIGAIRAISVGWLIAAAASPSAGSAELLFRLSDPRIAEASGIAAGLASPGVFYVANDGGDVNRFFALDRRSGATAAIVTVAGADNVDWEDVAVGRDASGTPSVWLADIGDNEGMRDEVRVYRVPEPQVPGGRRNEAITAHVASVWRLRYPQGPIDAESLAVAPNGSAYIVTKAAARARIYRLPPHPDAGRVQVLRPVGAVALLPTGTRNPFGLPGQLVATSASFAADGSVFAMRTYADAYIWQVGAAGLRAALRRPPVRTALPWQKQGEGICIAGRSLVVDSEGNRSAVYAVPLPRSATSPSATPSATAPASPSATAPASPSAPAERGAEIRYGALFTIVGLALLAVVVAAVRRAVRRRADQTGEPPGPAGGR
jgi:hypothetical protein